MIGKLVIWNTRQLNVKICVMQGPEERQNYNANFADFGRYGRRNNFAQEAYMC
jgi:hypothetical protein